MLKGGFKKLKKGLCSLEKALAKGLKSLPSPTIGSLGGEPHLLRREQTDLRSAPSPPKRDHYSLPKIHRNLRFPGFPTIFPLKKPFWDSYNPFYLFLEGLKLHFPDKKMPKRKATVHPTHTYFPYFPY